MKRPIRAARPTATRMSIPGLPTPPVMPASRCRPLICWENSKFISFTLEQMIEAKIPSSLTGIPSGDNVTNFSIGDLKKGLIYSISFKNVRVPSTSHQKVKLPNAKLHPVHLLSGFNQEYLRCCPGRRCLFSFPHLHEKYNGSRVKRA